MIFIASVVLILSGLYSGILLYLFLPTFIFFVYFQHLTSSENGQTVEYFVTGAANFVDTSTAHEDDVPAESLKFHWAKLRDLGGFSYVEATPQNMTMTFLDGMSHKLYEHSFPPRKLNKVKN